MPFFGDEYGNEDEDGIEDEDEECNEKFMTISSYIKKHKEGTKFHKA